MIEVKLLGVKKLLGVLSRRESGIAEVLKEELKELAIQVQNVAVKSIAKKSKGRIYRRGNKFHVASKPGDPPNTDEGRLIDSIQIDVDAINRFEVRVGTNVEYARRLEFGTRKVKPRPFLRPALKKVEAKNRNFDKVIARALVRKLGKKAK